jgi:hypothetical protein
MLAGLLSVPKSEQDWSLWSLNNRDALDQIRAAIATDSGVQLPIYQVYPIPFHDIETWLNNIQQAHNDFTDILGQQSNDLRDADLRDPNQLEAWIWLGYQEVLAACQKLGIGP